MTKTPEQNKSDIAYWKERTRKAATVLAKQKRIVAELQRGFRECEENVRILERQLAAADDGEF